jgi:hypothetical protein
MKSLHPDFENRAQPLISRHEFLLRMAQSGSIAAVLIAVSLYVGMAGYHFLEQLSWLDSFLNASMLLGGMGPVTTPVTDAGKVFAGVYALYSGLFVIFTAGLVLAPVAHRILHRFHIEGQDS